MSAINFIAICIVAMLLFPPLSSQLISVIPKEHKICMWIETNKPNVDYTHILAMRINLENSQVGMDFENHWKTLSALTGCSQLKLNGTVLYDFYGNENFLEWCKYICSASEQKKNIFKCMRTHFMQIASTYCVFGSHGLCFFPSTSRQQSFECWTHYVCTYP